MKSRALRHRAAVTTGAALLVLAGAAAAGPATASAEPFGNVYIATHGAPSCSWTFRAYHNGVQTRVVTSKGAQVRCGWYGGYDAAKEDTLYLHINSGTNNRTFRLYPKGEVHSYCFLVKAFGQASYTGDESRGCHAP